MARWPVFGRVFGGGTPVVMVPKVDLDLRNNPVCHDLQRLGVGIGISGTRDNNPPWKQRAE